MSAAREQIIRLSSLKVVLRERRIEIAGGRGLPAGATCIVLTAYMEAGACGGSFRNAWDYRKRLGMDAYPVRSHTRWMHPCDLTPVVKKVRTLSGLDAVKKTWGKGYKALLREIEPQRQVRP